MEDRAEPVHFLSSRIPSTEYTPLSTHDTKSYEIAPLPQLRLSNWKQGVLRLAPLTCTAALVSQWLYYALRVKYLTRCEISGTSMFLGVVLTAEVLACLHTLLSYPLKMAAGWIRPAKRLRLLGGHVPTVDIIVTCCGEPLDVLEDTIEATCALDYPEDRFRVIVSDDAGSSDLLKIVEGFSSRYSNIVYTARKIGKDHGYKAGNLNHALSIAEGLPDGQSEYVASLDSDMIPQPDWLRALLPHLILDARLGMASPPQLYYNLPPNDPLQQSLIPFYTLMEPLKQSMGVAWCTGSGYIMRRAALDDTNGFPSYSVCEDVYTSSLMLGAGWKTVFVNEPLQHGLMPDSLTAHLKQRTRWNIGSLQTAYKMRLCLFGHNARHMRPWQRISGVLFPCMIISNAVIAIPLIALPIALLLDFPLIGYSSPEELHRLLGLAVLTFATMFFNELVLSVEVGFRNALREIQAMHWMAPFHLVALIQAFVLPWRLGGRTAVFSASGSLAGNNERDVQLRAPLRRRVVGMLGANMLWVHLLVVVANLVGVALVIGRAVARFERGSREKHEYLLTHLGWPPLLWAVLTGACAGPLYYAVFPPSMPAREEMLHRDLVSGAACPKPEAKRLRWSWSAVGYEYWFSGAIAYSFFVWLAYR